MRSLDKYTLLLALGRPVITTGEAAVAWDVPPVSAAKQLSRLMAAGAITKLAHGVWQVTGTPDPSVVLPVLTNPYPSYVSGWSALSRHGMIEQIPRGVFAVSLDRARTVETTSGRYEIHHIHPELFGGFAGTTGIRAGIATAEKALFDIVYLLSTHSGTVTIPELDLPDGFDDSILQQWIDKIPSRRLMTITATNLSRIVETASSQLG